MSLIFCYLTTALVVGLLYVGTFLEPHKPWRPVARRALAAGLGWPLVVGVCVSRTIREFQSSHRKLSI